MAYPHWYYRDPSENIDFLRKKRERAEAQEREKTNAKEELEKLFKKEKGRA